MEASERTPLMPGKEHDVATPSGPATADGPSSPGDTNDKSRDRKRGLFLVSLVLFLFMASETLVGPVVVQYSYQVYTEQVYGNVTVKVTKTPCVNTTGTNTSSSQADVKRNKVQDESASFLMWLEVLTFSTGSLSCLLLGTYSDFIGRRLVLFMPVLGHLLRDASIPIIVHWDLGLSALYAGYAVYGVCGGTAGIILGSYVYSADVMVSEKERTVGIALMMGAIGAGVTVFLYVAGVFIEQTGFFYPSLTSGFGDVLGILIIVALLPETVRRDPEKRMITPIDSVRRILYTFLSRDNPQQRGLLLILLSALFLGITLEYPTMKLDVLYLMDKPFCWSTSQISLMQSIKYGTSRLTSMLLIPPMQRVLSTTSLAIFGTLSYLATNLLMGLAYNDLLVYLGAAAALGSTIMFSAVRGMLSRMVPDDRQGALFGGIAVFESVCFGVSQVAVFSLYEAVVSTMPGIAYLSIAGCFGFIILLYVIYGCMLSRSKGLPPTRNMEIQVEKSTENTEASVQA